MNDFPLCVLRVLCGSKSGLGDDSADIQDVQNAVRFMIRCKAMPLIEPSTYRPPMGLSSGHLQTIIPQLRNVNGVVYRRERIHTPDGDFLELDWAENGSTRLAILSHGLEGNSQRAYMLGMARAMQRRGWDALAWNYRGCGGEPNLKLRSYHSGETGDIHAVLLHVLTQDKYARIALIGFSLGGNITLKYLGEQGGNVHSAIRAAVTFSVPCDLESSARQLARFSSKIYMRRFLISLKEKIRTKTQMFPEKISDADFHRIKTFFEFDDRYTAPIHGFKDAQDYFAQSSSRFYLPKIRVPALLVNAKNDPFLAAPSFPYEEARGSRYFHFEAPASGGHTGFIAFNPEHEYWSEQRAAEFLAEHS